LGGVYFGGYAACVPILAGATVMIDARWVFVGCSLLGALANFTFAEENKLILAEERTFLRQVVA